MGKAAKRARRLLAWDALLRKGHVHQRSRSGERQLLNRELAEALEAFETQDRTANGVR